MTSQASGWGHWVKRKRSLQAVSCKGDAWWWTGGCHVVEWTSETGGVGKESNNLSGVPISPIMIRDKSISGLGWCSRRIGRPTTRSGLSKKPIMGKGALPTTAKKGMKTCASYEMPMQADTASVLVHVISGSEWRAGVKNLHISTQCATNDSDSSWLQGLPPLIRTAYLYSRHAVLSCLPH